MLNTTYTTDSGGSDELVFTKRSDTADSSKYSVSGLAASASRSLSVKHQEMKDGSARHLVDTTFTRVNPGSSSGATKDDRVYAVIQRSAFTTEAEIKVQIAALIELLGGDTFVTSILNKEL